MLFFSQAWDVFSAIDDDGDSRLSLEEFQTGCKRLGKASSYSSSTSARLLEDIVAETVVVGGVAGPDLSILPCFARRASCGPSAGL